MDDLYPRRTWLGWVLLCLAAPFIGVLALLSCIPAAMVFLIDIFTGREQRWWHDGVHRKHDA